MNKVYFSNKDDWGAWDDGDTGEIRVFLYPKKWWSLSEWKITRMFQKDFYCTFNSRPEESS